MSDTTNIGPIQMPLPRGEDEHMNYSFTAMQSMEKSLAAGDKQQLSDIGLTEATVEMEQTVSNYEIGLLQGAQDNVTKAASAGGDDPSQGQTNTLTSANSAYQQANAEYQMVTNQADSTTQSEATVPGQDAQASTQMVQLVQWVMSLLQAASSDAQQPM